MASDLPPARPRTGWASLKDLTGYQWFVFIVCCFAWDMDCMDQQLFVLARRPAMMELVPKIDESDARLPEFARKLTEKAAEQNKPAPTHQESISALHAADIGDAATYSTS